MPVKCKQNCAAQGKICNPASGKCVSRTGKIGRLIIDGALSKGPCGRKCRGRRTCNPSTGRCERQSSLQLHDSHSPIVVHHEDATHLIPRRSSSLLHRILSSRTSLSRTTDALSRTSSTRQDTTVRTDSHGRPQKIPKKRKAPGGHAADYQGQIRIGGDGNDWISTKVKKSWRWVPYR